MQIVLFLCHNSNKMNFNLNKNNRWDHHDDDDDDDDENCFE